MLNDNNGANTSINGTIIANIGGDDGGANIDAAGTIILSNSMFLSLLNMLY